MDKPSTINVHLIDKDDKLYVTNRDIQDIHKDSVIKYNNKYYIYIDKSKIDKVVLYGEIDFVDWDKVTGS